MSFKPNIENCPFCGGKVSIVRSENPGGAGYSKWTWDCVFRCFCADIWDNEGGALRISGKNVGIMKSTVFSSIEEFLRFTKLRSFQ